jgi:hypothetical protein
MLNLNPFLNAADAGTGGGSSQGTGAPPANTSGFTQQSQGSSQGASAPVSLSDDTPILIDGKTTTWKEHRAANFVPKADYDNVRNLTKQQIEAGIRNLAKQLNITPQQAQQMVNQRGGQQPPQDIFANYRELPLIDGANMVKALEGSLGPVAQAVAKMQQQLQAQDAQIKKLSGGVGVFAKDRASQERTGRVSAAITALGEGYDAKDPFLQDVAQDVLDAWDFGDKPEDFNKMLADRLNAAEKWVRARDQQKLKLAKERRFIRPGGNGQPSGAATPFKNQKFAAKEAADMLFGAQTNART